MQNVCLAIFQLLLVFNFQLAAIRGENEIMDRMEVPSVMQSSNGFTPLQCYNGGTLKNGKCECTQRFEGPECEFEPCLNEGLKTDTGCDCPWGTGGSRCETITYCTENNGKLVNGKCVCNDRFSGMFCQFRLCHYGNFVPQADTGYCKCDKGYTGSFCSQKLICIHGNISDENECVCDPNWTGDRCDRCAVDHRLVGNECKIVANEELLVAPQNGRAEVGDLWSVSIIVCASGVVIGLIVVISTILFKKRQTKPTKIDTTLGTDV